MRSRSLLEERFSPVMRAVLPVPSAAGFDAVHRTVEEALTDLDLQLDADDLLLLPAELRD